MNAMECDQPTVMGIRIEFDSWIPTVMGKCDSWIPTVMGKCDSWVPTAMGIHQLTCSTIHNPQSTHPQSTVLWFYTFRTGLSTLLSWVVIMGVALYLSMVGHAA